MANPCPDVRQLLLAVKSLTRQTEGTFQDAWADSFPDPYHCVEQGGFIYIDFPVPDRITRAYVTFAPKGISMNQRTEGQSGAIDLNNPGIKRDNVILVANFHTHPLSPDVEGNQEPSLTDINNAYFRGVPGIVISRDGIISYGPRNRVNVTNPTGYALPVAAPPGIPPTTIEFGPPPPWTVPNQWPEGTGEELKDIHMRRETRFEDDVVVLEWSDEDVVYGEPLVEA